MWKGLHVLVRDPVCGTEVDAARTVELSVFRGEVYHFCCQGCHATFDQNPEKYAFKPMPAEATAQSDS